MKTTYILLAFMAYTCLVNAQKIELEYKSADVRFEPGDFREYNGALYMILGYSYDGTIGSFDVSTKQFKSYDHIYQARKVKGFVSLNGSLYFAGGDFYSRYLYSINGSADPKVVWDAAHLDSVNYLAVYNNKLYFAGRANPQQTGIWSYDPSTSNLTAISLPPTLSNPRHLIAAGDLLYFVGEISNTTYLWSYDDISGQVKKISGITPQDGINFCADDNVTSITNSPSRTMIEYDGTLYFTSLNEDVNPNASPFLCYVDKATQKIKYVNSPGGGSDFLTELNGKLYRGYLSPGFNILSWYDAKTGISDSILIPSSNPPHMARISYLTAYNGRLFFNQVGSQNGIFAFDPVTESISKITDTLYNPLYSVKSNYMYVYNKKLYFTAKGNDSKYGLDIWSYYEHPTEVNQISKTEAPKIYPNPCKEYFSVKLPPGLADKNILIELFNTSGQLVSKQETGSNTKVNTAHLPAGLYFYRFSNGNTSWLGKFVHE